MASNRHLGRIIALQTLYEQDFRRASRDASFDLEEVLKRNVTRYEATVEDTGFIEELVRGVDAHEKELDEILQPLASEWPIDQIARMDRVMLHIGAYELVFSKGVPPKVVINEAVELAKAFGSENSSKFVNGVLGTLLRQRTGEPAPEKSEKVAPEAAVAEIDAMLTKGTPTSSEQAQSAEASRLTAAEALTTPAQQDVEMEAVPAPEAIPTIAHEAEPAPGAPAAHPVATPDPEPDDTPDDSDDSKPPEDPDDAIPTPKEAA